MSKSHGTAHHWIVEPNEDAENVTIVDGVRMLWGTCVAEGSCHYRRQKLFPAAIDESRQLAWKEINRVSWNNGTSLRKSAPTAVYYP